jgi:hypothetical protein
LSIGGSGIRATAFPLRTDACTGAALSVALTTIFIHYPPCLPALAVIDLIEDPRYLGDVGPREQAPGACLCRGRTGDRTCRSHGRLDRTPKHFSRHLF